MLGGFSLFLTFAIGIRFLVRPESTRADAPERVSTRTVSLVTGVVLVVLGGALIIIKYVLM